MPENTALPYETKGVPSAINSVKDVDAKTRTVVGYYADYGTRDAQNDVFAEDAFAESIKKWGPEGIGRIKHLDQHDVRRPVGKPKVLREDGKGLYHETQIVDSRAGLDVIKGYEIGLFEHSVGFSRIDEEPMDNGATLIKKAWLWEGSNVTWGANMNTPHMGFKSIEEAKDFLSERTRKLREFVKENISDEVGYQVELALLQLESEMKRLERYVVKPDEGEQKARPEAKEEKEPDDESQEEKEVGLDLPNINFFAADQRKEVINANVSFIDN